MLGTISADTGFEGALVDALGRSLSALPSDDPLHSEWNELHRVLRDTKLRTTVGRCARERIEIGRYSLSSWQAWYGWVRKAAS
jgi:hypothetical protein